MRILIDKHFVYAWEGTNEEVLKSAIVFLLTNKLIEIKHNGACDWGYTSIECEGIDKPFDIRDDITEEYDYKSFTTIKNPRGEPSINTAVITIYKHLGLEEPDLLKSSMREATTIEALDKKISTLMEAANPTAEAKADAKKLAFQYEESRKAKQVIGIKVCTYAELTSELVAVLLGDKDVDSCPTTNKNVIPNSAAHGMYEAIRIRIGSIQHVESIDESEQYLALFDKLLSIIELNITTANLNVEVAKIVCGLAIKQETLGPTNFDFTPYRAKMEKQIAKLVEIAKTLKQKLDNLNNEEVKRTRRLVGSGCI